jgi:hypothetical protein
VVVSVVVVVSGLVVGLWCWEREREREREKGGGIRQRCRLGFPAYTRRGEPHACDRPSPPTTHTEFAPTNYRQSYICMIHPPYEGARVWWKTVMTCRSGAVPRFKKSFRRSFKKVQPVEVVLSAGATRWKPCSRFLSRGMVGMLRKWCTASSSWQP